MSHRDCITFLESFYIKKTPRENKRHLKAMSHLLELFRINLDDFDIVQIAGSCGKGSTAAFISSILNEAGISHGLFTGPHLVDYEERFVINGHQMSREDFDTIVTEIKDKTEDKDLVDVGHMQLMILIAFMWYARKGIKLIVFENGAGGAADPSNVITPLIACITEITLDHMNLLGDSIEAITTDKAAIIKEGTHTVICGMYNKTARETLYKIEKMSDRHFSFIEREYSFDYEDGHLSYYGQRISKDGLEPSLKGDHQLQNATNALRVAEALMVNGYALDKSIIKRGIERAVWPGRLEKVKIGKKTIILDGAHNPFELDTLRQSLQNLDEKPSVILMSFASGKNIVDMLKAIGHKDAYFIVIPSPFFERRQSSEVVDQAYRELGLNYSYQEDFQTAWHEAMNKLKDNELLLVTGSLYLIGEVKASGYIK